ncbi:MAG: hypothetical protein DRO67_05300 [Candidatus Asgardarchaeum californiense]|nr:MAG: hypothetical protein DRO67_05300 [Candidatus Asgardarchaeum californiense]
MYLREKLDEKKLIKIKIKELENNILYGDSQSKDSIVKVLLSYIDDLQNINLILNKVNQQTELLIGKTKITIATAVEIRKAIKTKIDVITRLIEENDSKLDIIILIEQRDKLMDEYNSINNSIRMMDWSVKLD